MEQVVESMSVRATREGDVLIVVVAGMVTTRRFSDLARFVRDALEARDARAVVLDMLGATQLLTEDGWLSVAREAAARFDSLAAVPVAMLVAPVAFEAVRRHCRRMAAYGFLRLTFVERAVALAWASRRLEYWEREPALPRA